MNCSEQIDGQDTEKDDATQDTAIAHQKGDICDKACRAYYQQREEGSGSDLSSCFFHLVPSSVVRKGWLRLLANNPLTIDITAHACVAPLRVAHNNTAVWITIKGSLDRIAPIVENLNKSVNM